ncbi:hypothetical protein RASY3_14475 [Ruminococcus albus SY3]|uniref:Uncharacterized protein n=1 Tax=Ruminococcus albus SY3 TaxID=1341156 RepID=A0A011UZC8_RUMAL|nr:hypothetical protein [Ruminococcus albus]EXM38527.1 hypothetical protein RASY3_14475 [Ruminococcus albus SY3]
MKIEYSNSSFIRLSNILSGETFIADNTLYIKGEKSGIDDIVCVSLADGHIKHFFEADMVRPVKTKIIIESSIGFV